VSRAIFCIALVFWAPLMVIGMLSLFVFVGLAFGWAIANNALEKMADKISPK